MTTQSLRGMANHGPMHWRGDRTGGNDAPSAQPDSGTFDERAAFKKFNVGVRRPARARRGRSPTRTWRRSPTSSSRSPIRRTRSATSTTRSRRTSRPGATFFFDHTPDGPRSRPTRSTTATAATCSIRSGNAQFGVRASPGFFGTDGRYSFEARDAALQDPAPPQPVPEGRDVRDGHHLRSGRYDRLAFRRSCRALQRRRRSPGDQVRGFGFLHDGATDTMFRFHRHDRLRTARRRSPDPRTRAAFPSSPIRRSGTAQQQLIANITLRRQVEAFMLAFDSNLAPIVGQQATLTARAARRGRAHRSPRSACRGGRVRSGRQGQLRGEPGRPSSTTRRPARSVPIAATSDRSRRRAPRAGPRRRD